MKLRGLDSKINIQIFCGNNVGGRLGTRRRFLLTVIRPTPKLFSFMLYEVIFTRVLLFISNYNPPIAISPHYGLGRTKVTMWLDGVAEVTPGLYIHAVVVVVHDEGEGTGNSLNPEKNTSPRREYSGSPGWFGFVASPCDSIVIEKGLLDEDNPWMK